MYVRLAREYCATFSLGEEDESESEFRSRSSSPRNVGIGLQSQVNQTATAMAQVSVYSSSASYLFEKPAPDTVVLLFPSPPSFGLMN